MVAINYNIERKYLCLACEHLNVEPHQSSCGCRYCQNCVETLDDCVQCKEPIKPYNKDKAFRKEIEKTTCKCPKCEWNGAIIDLNSHLKEHSKQICKLCDKEIDDLAKHSIEFAEKHLEIMGDLYHDFKKLKATNCGNNDDNAVLFDDIVSIVKQDSVNLLKQIESFKSYCEKLENELKQTQKTVMLQQTSIISLEERLNTTANICKSGEFLWKITNVKDKFLEAKGGRQTSIYSVPFFTSEYGYKLCARVYLNGDGCGKGTHLSLFIAIMKGPYDNLLEWPFKQKITFALIDQDSGKGTKENIVDAFRPDPKSNSFSKPTSEMNIASGIPLFCPLTKLLSSDNGYIKDDCLFIKIVVNNSGLI